MRVISLHFTRTTVTATGNWHQAGTDFTTEKKCAWAHCYPTIVQTIKYEHAIWQSFSYACYPITQQVLSMARG